MMPRVFDRDPTAARNARSSAQPFTTELALLMS
jgi:hypothetical protein